MSLTSKMGKSGHDKTGSGVFFSEAASHRSTSRPRQTRGIILTCTILWSFFLQLSHSSMNTKKLILIFSQLDKLQLRFYPMGHYVASTFTSHVRIPFNYSALLHLQPKMIDRMDTCITDLDHFNFKLSEYNCVTLNSFFELYKSDTIQIFKLSQDLLASLPHVPERQ